MAKTSEDARREWEQAECAHWYGSGNVCEYCGKGQDWTTRCQEYQEYAQSIRERAQRVTRMIIDDARATCNAAGLDGSLLGIHPHNAMVSAHYGKPWPGVDYSLVRKTLWLIERSYEPHRIADRVVQRAFDHLMEGGK